MKIRKSKVTKARLQSVNTDCGFACITNILFIVLTVCLGYGCSKRTNDHNNSLNPLEVYNVSIPETSDLCFGASTDILYTVSDRTAKAYKITTQGKVLSELAYTGNDLEGVCYVGNQFLYVAEERLRRIMKLDLQGIQLSEKSIPVEKNDENSGLEGISYATFNKHFYILNEKNPGLLIETDENLNIIKSQALTFSSDYSGICVDNVNQQLWIVCDEMATVNQCTMEGVLIKSYSIPVTNPEGIAYDPISKNLYIISDAEARLYHFNLTDN